MVVHHWVASWSRSKSSEKQNVPCWCIIPLIPSFMTCGIHHYFLIWLEISKDVVANDAQVDSDFLQGISYQVFPTQMTPWSTTHIPSITSKNLVRTLILNPKIPAQAERLLSFLADMKYHTNKVFQVPHLSGSNLASLENQLPSVPASWLTRWLIVIPYLMCHEFTRLLPRSSGWRTLENSAVWKLDCSWRGHGCCRHHEANIVHLSMQIILGIEHTSMPSGHQQWALSWWKVRIMNDSLAWRMKFIRPQNQHIRYVSVIRICSQFFGDQTDSRQWFLHWELAVRRLQHHPV